MTVDLSWLAMQPPPDTAPRPPTQSAFRWATVTSTTPLRIRMDGETADLPDTPQSLAGGLTMGRRVWVQIYGRRVIVHGAISTDTGKVTDFSNVGDTLWVRTIGGSLYGDTFWRVADGWAECFVVLQAPGDRTITSSQVQVATCGFRPPTNAFGVWRIKDGSYRMGEGLISPTGGLYLIATPDAPILFDQQLEFRMIPFRMDA